MNNMNEKKKKKIVNKENALTRALDHIRVLGNWPDFGQV
jgi:hypothetical protein